mgnify:CR=1 FL=1
MARGGRGSEGARGPSAAGASSDRAHWPSPDAAVLALTKSSRAQVLEEKEGEADELSDKVEALVQQVADKDAQLQAEQDEVDALTHDLQKVRLASLTRRGRLSCSLAEPPLIADAVSLPLTARRPGVPARGGARR